MDRSHVVFPFDSVIDEYSTAKSGELLCTTLQEEQEESAANVGREMELGRMCSGVYLDLL